MWPTKYWKQILETQGQENNYFITGTPEEEESATSNTSCFEITEEEYRAAVQSVRA